MSRVHLTSPSGARVVVSEEVAATLGWAPVQEAPVDEPEAPEAEPAPKKRTRRKASTEPQPD